MTEFLVATGVDISGTDELLCFAIQTADTLEPLDTILTSDILENVDGANPETRVDSTEFIFDTRELHDVVSEQICARLETAGHTVSPHLGEVVLTGEASVFDQLTGDCN